MMKELALTEYHLVSGGDSDHQCDDHDHDHEQHEHENDNKNRTFDFSDWF